MFAQVFSELELMSAMGSHTNLVSLQGACETPSSWILILDLADGGTLFDHIVEHDCLNEALASVVAAEGDRRPMERLVEEQGEGARASVASALKNAWHLFFLTKRVRGTHTRSLRQHCA